MREEKTFSKFIKVVKKKDQSFALSGNINIQEEKAITAMRTKQEDD